MAQEIERVFGLPDDEMLERAQVFHDRLSPELASFTARFPWLDATWLTAFQNDITAADQFPKDESVTLDIKILTGDVNSAMQQGYAALQALGGYAKLAYPTDISRQRGFGQQYWRDAYSNTLKLQEALELAYAKADDATLKPALLAKGYTQADIDQLETLAMELQTKNGLQEAAKIGRKVSRHDRVSLLNVVWDHMRTVNICASVVWAADAARMEQYQLYPSAGGGNDGNGDGNEPPATGVRIAGSVTSTNGGGPIENAKVMVYDQMTGPGYGSMEVFTDASGTFTLVIEELPGPINAVLEASALGHYMQNRILNLMPGLDYDGQDFQLQATS